MKILFFSPHSGIRLHSVQENVFAKTLLKNKIDVRYVTCGGLFKDHCNVMSAHGVKSNTSSKIKEKICLKYKYDAATILKKSNIQNYILLDFILDEDISTVNNAVSSITQNNFLYYKFENINIGKIAFYEVLLHYKKMSLTFEEIEWKEYIIYFKNTLLSLIAYKKIFNIYHSDTMLVYSPQYTVNGAAAEYTIGKKRKVYFIEGSSSNAERYEAVRLWDWEVYGLTNPEVNFWDKKKNLVNKSMIDRAVKHIDQLLNAKSFAVYSLPKSQSFNLRHCYQILEDKKIVLATLSSFDEAFTAHAIGKFSDTKVKCPYFKDQFEWIENTINFFSNKKNICLIIRMHPRDFPNKRENIKSEQADVWINLFKELPSNIIINFPDEEISLYDILPHVDVLLTGWSATAIEAMLYKIPVVTYYKYLPSYPAEIHYTGLTIHDYYQNLNTGLDTQLDEVHAKNTIKWMALNFSMGTIKTSSPLLTLPYNNKICSFILKVVKKLFSNLLFILDLKLMKCSIDGEKILFDILSHQKSSIYEYYNSIKILASKDLDEHISLLANKYFVLLGVKINEKI